MARLAFISCLFVPWFFLGKGVSTSLSLSLSVSDSESTGLLLGFFFLVAHIFSSSPPLVLSWGRLESSKQVWSKLVMHVKHFTFFLFPSHNFCSGGFHLMSPQPRWCHKTNKQQPCWCPELTLSELTCIFMQICFSVSVWKTRHLITWVKMKDTFHLLDLVYFQMDNMFVFYT